MHVNLCQLVSLAEHRGNRIFSGEIERAREADNEVTGGAERDKEGTENAG